MDMKNASNGLTRERRISIVITSEVYFKRVGVSIKYYAKEIPYSDFGRDRGGGAFV